MQTTAMKDPVDSKEEPSMEEILASIRKIISEQDAPQPVVEPVVEQVQESVLETIEETAEEPLELTQVLEEDGSITDLTISRTSSETFEEILATEIASEQSEQEALAPQEPSEEAIVSADVVMEISDISSDAGANPRSEALVFAVDTQQDASSQDNFAEIESEPVEDAEIDDAAVEEAFLPPHLDIHAQLENIAAEMNKEDEEFTMQQVFDEDPVSPSVTPVEGLLSATAAQASLAALANLKRSLVQPTPVKVSTEEGRTVEDLLGDLLKPLLKEWLDTNLPLMVEKIVSQEIKKLTSAL